MWYAYGYFRTSEGLIAVADGTVHVVVVVCLHVHVGHQLSPACSPPVFTLDSWSQAYILFAVDSFGTSCFLVVFARLVEFFSPPHLMYFYTLIRAAVACVLYEHGRLADAEIWKSMP